MDVKNQKGKGKGKSQKGGNKERKDHSRKKKILCLILTFF